MGSKIFIVDEMMGAGKTSAAINYMNRAPSTERFMFVTPFLSEIEDRIIPLCKAKDIATPISSKGDTKYKNLVELVSAGRNIATTHALFDRMTPRLAQMIADKGYTLIMDEVHDSLRDFGITKHDWSFVAGLTTIDSQTGLVRWDDDMKDYTGKFEQMKYMCDTKQLYNNGGASFVRAFPCDIFTLFTKAIFLTYMFDAQVQRCFFDLNGIEYERLYVQKVESEYFFTDKGVNHGNETDYRSLIHILDNERMNRIGNDRFSLCAQWYGKADSEQLQQIKSNLVNFFINITKSRSRDNMWTAFKNTKQALAGKGYTKGFVSARIRATNKYRERINVAYPINVYLEPGLKRFFISHGVRIDEDRYALSEMLQCLWRSAIRDGKEIWVYIPSARMRGLLEQWIEDNSPAADIFNKEEI